MKIRSDFVSNSSSSSFLISTDSNYTTNDLVKDISINCKCSYWDNEKKMSKILNNYVSLFVGGIRIADSVIDYNKDDRLFGYYENLLLKFGSELEGRFTYLDDNRTIIRERMKQYRDCIVTFDHMKEILKLDGEDLLNYISDSSNFEEDVLDDGYQSSSYIINEDSIVITEKLIALGKEFQFDNNITYESIKDTILNKKEKVYNIHINTDGNGCDDDCFRYERQSEDDYINHAFNDLKVKILTSESY